MTLFLALLLDAAAGEPRWLWSHIPHPAVLMGRAVTWVDENFNQDDRRRQRGILACVGLCLVAGVTGVILSKLPFAWVFEVLVAAILIAQRSLVDHVRTVEDALRLSVGDGRVMVARIVGRDTSGMDGPDIARAAIESAAENFSDGVVAPVFWFAVAGLPGLLIYKMVNTADSMIGYRTEKYEDFGWAAARLDDVLNWIPARLSALLILASLGAWRAWPTIRHDAQLHRSPNAGWPEAAMAVSLDVALAGPRSYDGELRDFPYVHPTGRKDIGPVEIDAAISALWRAWGVLLGLSFAIALF